MVSLHCSFGMFGEKKSDKYPKGVKDVQQKKIERTIPGILFHKYKDIPRPMPNKISANWEPEFV